MNLGVHLSLGRRPVENLEAARLQGVDSAQIFASSPGAWRPPSLTSDRTRAIIAARQSSRIDPLFIHAVYLINLASSDHVLFERSRASLKAALEAGSSLDAAGVVTHIGSHKGDGFESVASEIAAGLVDILSESPDDVDLILENSAGSGGIIGSRIEELGKLIELANNHPRLKIALDTAHLCAAGWDLTQPGTGQDLVDRIETEVGLDRLALIHANDSKTACGSRVDRHAVIGEGHIGLTGFRNLLSTPQLTRVPWVLETPDLGEEEKDFRSLKTLRDLAETVLGSSMALRSSARKAS